jgi:SAM-dependent methyltransferase
VKRDNTMTKRYLADAGIGRGMRVLEIGCGGGEVTEVLAELVGSSGSVVALDRNAAALEGARARLQQQGLNHVRFLPADVTASGEGFDALLPGEFDALAGRRVLMYLKDPADVLRSLRRYLTAGALVVFEEADATLVPGRLSSMPAHDEAMECIRRMLVAEGANTSMGFCLPATFVQAGLRFERIRAEAVIQGQGTQYPLRDLLQLVQSRLLSAGIVTVDVFKSLVERLDLESREPTNVYVSDLSFCAWARNASSR